MATVAARGSGIPATTGTTWATATNAVDGAAGTDPATYATLTSTTASAVATIEITGYGFSSLIAATDTLTNISVSLRHFENNTGRFASVAVTVWDGATQIGGSNNATLATAARNDAFTYTPTLAQLRSSTFKVRVTITGAASTQSRVESIDYVDVTATYTVVPPAITQAAYRFYADGTETGSTALAAENTAYTADVTAGDVSLLVRTRLQLTTAVATPATDDWQLQWEKNASGTWTSIGSAVLADSYPSSNYDTATSLSDAARLRGQSFLGNGRKLQQARFWGYKNNSPTDNVVCNVYAHTETFGSGTATGSALATATPIAASSVTGTSAVKDWITFTFDGTFTLVAGTPYVIAVGRSGATDLTNMIFVGADASSPTHPGCKSDFDVGAWSADVFSDLIFEVYTQGSTVLGYNSTNLTDGAATTNRLTAGTGSFVAGKVSEDGLVDDLGWSASNYTELLYAVTLKQADLATSDTLRFRVIRNGATTEMTYSQTPTINVTKTSVGGRPKVYLASAFTTKPLKVWTGSAWTEKPVKVWTGSTWKTLT